MKRLFIHTTTLLRTVLLLGAILLFGTGVKGQTAGLPDAFETMDPATIIGDGQYYYIQFYYGNIRSYLTDCGVEKKALTKDFLPYAHNRLWTLLPAGDGDATHFKLRNKAGNYIGYKRFSDANGDRYGIVSSSADAVILVSNQNRDGYDISLARDLTTIMYRNSAGEWTELPNISHSNHTNDNGRLRFVKLKSNSAFIIYYRGEGLDNTNSGAETTRHYLTYSGTGNQVSAAGTLRNSAVSSRQSIIPKDKPLPSLPTLAAYHKDGLWTLEEAGDDGGFYIKKYGNGTNDYLLNSNDNDNIGILGEKDKVGAKYKVEDTGVNRYTPIVKVNYTETDLTKDMFKTWDGYGAGATGTGDATVDFNVGNGATIDAGGMVAGTGGVECLTYADLSEYSKMVINGTEGMPLRVLMSRQESNSGPYVEKNVTIGSDGKAVVDLTNLELKNKFGSATVKMTYIDKNNAETSFGEIAFGQTAKCGYNKISNGSVELTNEGWNVNFITYLQVDASAIQGDIAKVTLRAEVSGSTDDKRGTTWGVGYNNSVWSPELTWNTAERSITQMGDEVSTTTKSSTTFEAKVFDISQAFTNDADKIVTILVYETAAAGGYIKNPTVEVEYIPFDKEKVSYAHLNAIKAGWGGASGTISSITLLKESGNRYLHHSKGDGWQVEHWTEKHEGELWDAAFFPVEVVDKDEFYQVSLKYGEQMVGVGSDQTTALKPYNDFNPELWRLEQVDDYQHFSLQSWNGKYYGGGIGTSLTTAPTEISNSHIISTFSTIEWLLKYETRIMHDVTHKVSNVKLYYTYNPTTSERQKVLSEQGLITDAYSDWWNYDTGTQKVNEFKITHYVKKGDVVTYGLPTVLTTNNDHRLYQRWYKYGDDRNLEDLKNHFRLKVDNQEVMSYLYNNGIVTGQKLDWETIFPGVLTFELNKLSYYNCDGQPFTLAADVSRYSDFTYKNTSSHLDGDLEEPSLTMRYIYEMHDAKEMATALMACTYNNAEDKWYEKEKEVHFPATRLQYESGKNDEFKGEFLGIRHQFKDYWVFDGNGTTDDNLVSAVTNNTSGKIEVVLDDVGGTGITLAGYNNQGFYCYRERSTSPYVYGDSRFVAFKYPGANVNATGASHPAYLYVYFNNNGTRYQVAKFKLIFDENSATLPWTSVNGSAQVKDTDRDPNNLMEKAGKPIAKITFDYPTDATFKCASDFTIHNKETLTGWWHEIANSSPVPLTFENTNYGFDGDDPSWGSYALVSTMNTRNGHSKTAMPANDATYGYNIASDHSMEKAFLYIDASEQPGDICTIPFTGEFCADDKLMCSGWISGSNRLGAAQSAGSVTISVKGKRTENGNTVSGDLYRFCPGQCYELDNGTGTDGSEGADHVVWQQFYFEFKLKEKYDSYWVEVNNNCVSSMGGDFMLDNIEVYAFVPEATPTMNTPICVNKDASDMQLLKVSVGFDKLLSAVGETEVTGDDDGEDKSYAFVYLDKEKFLSKFQEELAKLNVNKTKAQLETIIQSGEYGDLVTNNYAKAYQTAFNYAVLGDPTKIWDSNNPTVNTDAAVLNFHWNTNFGKMEAYTFAKAANRQGIVFVETDSQSGERLIVMNGNYNNTMPWKVNTDYYIVPYNGGVTGSLGNSLYEYFNICSVCSKKKVFLIEAPLDILTIEGSDATRELEVCEGTIPTVLTELKGYTASGVEVPLTNLNFDWWLGDLSANPKVLATLENYHNQQATIDGVTVRLDEALAYFRVFYPNATTLTDVTPMTSGTQEFTLPMIKYLQELVDNGQLILHQKSISVPAIKASDDDPYFYLVASPIRDASFTDALGTTEVAYHCEEPQGLRMKVGEKAPTLKCGFVPNENGFTNYAYPDGNLVLSVRLAKKAQFETVQHGSVNEVPLVWEDNADVNFLWLPIRDAKVQSVGSSKVIVKSDDCDIYLASTDDPTWEAAIYTEMTKVNATTQEPEGSLPVVGKIVKLNAIDTDRNSGKTEKDENRLCIYFTENFEVREGYSYTLSLPFREDGDANTCDGTLLINLKIVPDYEVWTGAAGNTDWNNDKNWRRADGNTANSGINQDELYVGSAASNSPLYGYTTNYDNYRTDDDRSLRKGFAPLYCTHILMKGDEWADAPVLYDAVNGEGSLANVPFPNLNEAKEVKSLKMVVDQRFETISALTGQAFAIVNETEDKAIYGTTAQNLGYAGLNTAMQSTNTGYYFKLETQNGKYAFRLQTPNGDPYTVWGRDGYLNSQPVDGSVSFILGLTNWSNELVYGQDGANLALWEIVPNPDNNGTFALKNVGTDKYLKDNTNAQYDTPTYFTFCTLTPTAVTTIEVGENALKYDIQTRVYDIWSDTYGSNPDKGRTGDLISEMYQINSCDEIAFQPATELINAHLLNYNNAWMEYQLDMNRWYLLGSPLQGTISGEWYAPTGTAQQKTTYYDNVTFGSGYDRYSPAIYQRSWDKAKTVLYEVGSTYANSDDSQTENLGSASQGQWSSGTWNTTGADNYLDRLGYKPMGGKKVNVAIKGVWSNTYNDATVDYATGGFSVMVLNNLKSTGAGNANPAIIRLPKEDTMYDYYRFDETGTADGGTDTDLSTVQNSKNRAKNRGRLKTDLLLPNTLRKTEASTSKYASIYGARTITRIPRDNSAVATVDFTETVSAGEANMGYYLVENPFPCGLDMNQFFAENSGLEKKYWLLTAGGQQLVQWADNQWVNPNGTSFATDKAVVAPGQGFFVQATTPGEANDITFTDAMQAQTRYGVKSGQGYTQDTDNSYPLLSRQTRSASKEENDLLGLVITAQRDSNSSSALVMLSDDASNDFLPSEDTETFLNSDLKNIPTVYTLCGRLATTINTVNDFSCLPLGVESNSSSPCTLTFRGVETLGDSIAFYDAVEQKLTPLESGMQFTVSGQTQNRYYLVTSLNQEKVAEETHLQIFTVGLVAKVIASTAEPILHVRCFDLGGRQVHMASPQSPEYSFNLPAAGVYIIEAETENDHKIMKVMAK